MDQTLSSVHRQDESSCTGYRCLAWGPAGAHGPRHQVGAWKYLGPSFPTCLYPALFYPWGGAEVSSHPPLLKVGLLTAADVLWWAKKKPRASPEGGLQPDLVQTWGGGLKMPPSQNLAQSLRKEKRPG